MMIFPSDWSDASLRESSPMLVVILPSPLNVVSRRPSCSYRTTAKPLLELPAAMILSLCNATDLATAYSPRLVVTLPSPSNEVSRLPSLL